MKKLSLQLNQQYKSFESGFSYTFDGDLIILSGVNGTGKSQLLSMIFGFDRITGQIISSLKSIDGNEIKIIDIDSRSFKENVSIPEITASTSQSFINTRNSAWVSYDNYRLDPQQQHNSTYQDSCAEAKSILLQRFDEASFYQGLIPQNVFDDLLAEAGFVWKQGDKFTNSIGEIFFNHALKVSEEMKSVGRANFDLEKFEIAPWTKLNNLFAKLKLEYRFRSNYEIFRVEITEQPKLFALQSDGTLDENNWRNLFDLSDGEKAIISLCFASLSGSNLTVKKLLLLDEYDAVLNPSLIQMFFTVIKDFFVDKGVLVIMATHSPATISLAPEYAKYYEIFKPNQDGSRILEVSKDDYAELRIANKSFYDKIENQSKRIKELEGTIQSDEDVLIITEGKTDWKYIFSALRYFHSKGEFTEIEEKFFYKFGSEDDVASSVCGTEYINDLSDSKLKNFLSSSLEARKIDNHHVSQKRIGIFDSDNRDIKVIVDESKGIFSFKIEPSEISTELLFLDEEIKTLVDGRRLYIGDEFHERSKRHQTDTNLTLGDGSQNINKAGKRTVVESGVYDSTHQNIALPKEKFAQAIYDKKITISETSWENFKHIFENIQKCLRVKAEETERVVTT